MSDAWTHLRAHTSARIGLPRAGNAVTTREHLAFQMAHAQAQDAVHDALDVESFLAGLRRRDLPALAVRSVAHDRATYLKRPDLGRTLSDSGHALLQTLPPNPADLAIVIADGLSARAVKRHALALLDMLLPVLQQEQWTLAPIVVVEQGRVAIGDDIGAALNAAIVAVLIGERPGLSSPDSLGVYLTWAPRGGLTDGERNCISNIRPEGLSYGNAAARMMFLLTEARRRKLTGVMLKDETLALAVLPASS